MATNEENIKTQDEAETLADTTEQDPTVAAAENSAETPAKEAAELDPLAKAEADLAEMKDKYTRLYADFDNFRKRTVKEKIDMSQTAGKAVLSEMVGVLDDFNRANASFETVTEIEPLKEGLALVYAKFQKTLETQGVKIMDAKGADFNADFHECITQFPAPSEDLKNKIVDVIENGYMLHDTVLRYAKVVVGS